MPSRSSAFGTGALAQGLGKKRTCDRLARHSSLFTTSSYSGFRSRARQFAYVGEPLRVTATLSPSADASSLRRETLRSVRSTGGTPARDRPRLQDWSHRQRDWLVNTSPLRECGIVSKAAAVVYKYLIVIKITQV